MSVLPSSLLSLSRTQRPILTAQHLLIKLAHACLRNGIHEDHFVGEPPFCYTGAQVVEDFVLGDPPNMIGPGHHKGMRTLIPLWMRQAYHTGLQYLGMAHNQAFKFNR